MTDATMTDAAPDGGREAPDGGRYAYYAERPNPLLDDVILQGDYAMRAYLSFYRFRRLGGTEHANKSVGKDKASGRRRTLKDVERGESLDVGIHFVSDHPPVRIFAFSMIALLVLFESAANAYFFSLNNPLGFLGGLFQAAAVSLSNVAVAYFIVGFWGLRHVTVPFRYHWPKKIFGFLAIAVGLVVIVIVNLSAAHFRNLQDMAAENIDMAALPATATASPWTFIPGMAENCDAILGSPLGVNLAGAAANALCRPLNLYSLDAVVLFALGMAIAAVAAFEGRRSDSTFPGLSDAARKVETSRADLMEALQNYYDSYGDVVDQLKDDLKADGENNKDFTREDREALYRLLDWQVEPYRRLLATTPTQLVDEFDVPIWLLEDLEVPGAAQARRELEGSLEEES